MLVWFCFSSFFALCFCLCLGLFFSSEDEFKHLDVNGNECLNSFRSTKKRCRTNDDFIFPGCEGVGVFRRSIDRF
jgi:hypothetical protein